MFLTLEAQPSLFVKRKSAVFYRSFALPCDLPLGMAAEGFQLRYLEAGCRILPAPNMQKTESYINFKLYKDVIFVD